MPNADQMPSLDVQEQDVEVPDRSPVVRLAGPAFAVFSVVLVPWIVFLALTLPSRQLSPHYDVAWAGFDTMECVALACTAYFTIRRSMFLSTAATATAALLVVDAWFDVVTTPAAQRLESIVLAAVVELPLAALCLWLSYHTVHIVEHEIVLLRRPRLRLRRRHRQSRRQQA